MALVARHSQRAALQAQAVGHRGAVASRRRGLRGCAPVDTEVKIPFDLPIRPVLVLIDYRIAPKQARAFARAMRALRRIRLRDGAFRWGLFGDTADPGRYMETFVVASWAEPLRLHERMTVGDREVRNRAMAFHIGANPAQRVILHLFLCRERRALTASRGCVHMMWRTG